MGRREQGRADAPRRVGPRHVLYGSRFLEVTVPIKIVDWETRYENNRTRDLKRMQWVPMPNRHDGDGYTTLLDHPNGAAHFGAWCALVQVASRCDERGALLRHGAGGHDSASLARMTRIPEAVWLEVLPRLLSIGWIED